MPNEKAHGIQIAKMVEAFIEKGIDLTLVVPQRGMSQPLREFYNLRVDVPLRRLWSFNWYNHGRTGYFISSLSFMLTSLLFLWWRRLRGEQFIIYTIDLDNYSSSALPLVGLPLYTEMHGGKPNTFVQRFLFSHLRGVFAINQLIIEEFKKRFSRSTAYYLALPNGVDLDLFATRDKHVARVRLGLQKDEKIALYTGRFFEWKGLEILPQAAEQTPDIEWYIVGGAVEDFCAVTGRNAVPINMHFMGSQAQAEIPWWLVAADALIVLGTVRDIQSYRYTSPMKLFEYLATGRPIIASRTPAVREIVSEREVFFYEPDNALDLARVVQQAVTQSTQLVPQIEASMRLATASSWSVRAERIVQFMKENAPMRPYA